MKVAAMMGCKVVIESALGKAVTCLQPCVSMDSTLWNQTEAENKVWLQMTIHQPRILREPLFCVCMSSCVWNSGDRSDLV